MGDVETSLFKIASTDLFSNLQRLLVARDYLAFATNIQSLLEADTLPNREVFLLLLQDAFDLLEPTSTLEEQAAIKRLYDRHIAGRAQRSQSQPSVMPTRPAITQPPADSIVIQMRRVVQVTSYSQVGFEASNRFSLQRTVYRSPQERTFHRAVLLRYPGLLALPNYPLAAVLNEELFRKVVPKRMYAFTMRCALDVLLVTPGEGDPIAAFELDSTFHDEPAAQERDKLKDKALALAGIPHYRLRLNNSDTVTVDDWYAILTDQIGDIVVPKRHRSREQGVSWVPA